MSDHRSSVSRRVRELGAQIRSHGLRGGVRYFTERVPGYTAYRWHLFNEWRADRSFGIETRREVALGSLDLSSARHADSAWYQATPYPAIRKSIEALPMDSFGDYTFVDLGCGKGRALVLAGAAGFGSVVGVELDPVMVTSARDNLARARARGKIASSAEVLTTDAASLDFPDAPLVLFLHNPFGEATMREVVASLNTSWARRPRPIFVIYYNAVHNALFDPSDWDIAARYPSDGFTIYEHRQAPEGTGTA
jgi:SAM-dependent methyltransferase